MKPILVIFNGIQFPYYLMEYSLVLAWKQGLALHALFLTARREISETYAFPNDMELVEKAFISENLDKENSRIIKDRMKIASDMAIFEEVECTTEHITNCSLHQISGIITGYDQVFVDVKYDNENSSMLCNTAFSLAELMALAPAKIKQVSAELEIPLK